MRIFDLVYSQFQAEVCEQTNPDSLPLASVKLDKIFKKATVKYKTELKMSLSEIATFDEVLVQSDLFEHKIKDFYEEKRKENYSAGYFFTVGLLQQLKDQYFPKDEKFLTSEELVKRWREMMTYFRHNSGDDFQSKWDVYAECLIRIQANQRFVNYSDIEVEEMA